MPDHAFLRIAFAFALAAPGMASAGDPDAIFANGFDPEPIVAPSGTWTWVPFPETRCGNNSATGLGTGASGGTYTDVSTNGWEADPNGNGNSYTVDIGAATGGGGGENSCCEASALPGCNDPEVLSCVCAVDSFCCQVQFDSLCVSEALQCGTTCSNEGAESDCCSASDAPGCTDQAVHDCVCATDFSCCSSGFDEVCVAQAIGECGAQCSQPPPVSDCCSASSVPGCTVPEVQACVCAIDPFCCAGGFDENCAALADQQCGAECQF